MIRKPILKKTRKRKKHPMDDLLRDRRASPDFEREIVGVAGRKLKTWSYLKKYGIKAISTLEIPVGPKKEFHLENSSEAPRLKQLLRVTQINELRFIGIGKRYFVIATEPKEPNTSLMEQAFEIKSKALIKRLIYEG